jgi:hypothetical protein
VESFTVNPHVKSSPSTGSFFVPAPATTERRLTKTDLNEIKTLLNNEFAAQDKKLDNKFAAQDNMHNILAAQDNKFFLVPVLTTLIAVLGNAAAVYVVKTDAVDAATKKAQEVATAVAKIENANGMISVASVLIIFFILCCCQQGWRQNSPLENRR